jgi:hypothetical protein
MYTAGNVKFDATPYVNFAIGLMAKKKAEDDALTQYYEKLPSTINEAGMRDQDREPFMQGMNQVSQFWKQNKDAIKNPRIDGGAAQYNYEKMLRSQKELVEKSKNAAKTGLELGKLKFNKDFNYVFDDPKIMENVQQHDLPINHPDHKPLDIYEMTVPPKPLDLKDQTDFNKAIRDGLQFSEKEVGRQNLGNFKIKTTIQKAYDKDALATMGQRAGLFYDNDRRFRLPFANEYRQIISDPETLAEYTETFKEVYGKEPESQKDFFVAKQIMSNRIAATEEKTEDDVYGRQVAMENRRFANQKTMEGIRQSNRKAIKAYGAAKNAEEKEGILNKHINEQIADGDTAPTVTLNGKKYNGKFVKVPKSIEREFAVNEGGDNYKYADAFMITNDKKYVIPVYKSGKHTQSGNPVLDGAKSKPILMRDYKAMLAKEWLTKSDSKDELNDDFDDVDVTVVEEEVTPSKPTKAPKAGKYD